MQRPADLYALFFKYGQIVIVYMLVYMYFLFTCTLFFEKCNQIVVLNLH